LASDELASAVAESIEAGAVSEAAYVNGQLRADANLEILQ
jgi:hypothetical protein